jgi:hypothetical protein
MRAITGRMRRARALAHGLAAVAVLVCTLWSARAAAIPTITVSITSPLPNDLDPADVVQGAFTVTASVTSSLAIQTVQA